MFERDGQKKLEINEDQVKELHAKIGELAVANGTGGLRGPAGATVRP